MLRRYTIPQNRPTNRCGERVLAGKSYGDFAHVQAEVHVKVHDPVNVDVNVLANLNEVCAAIVLYVARRGERSPVMVIPAGQYTLAAGG